MSTEGPTAISSRSQFQAAIRLMLSQACELGSAEIVCVDANFADWPLNERSVIETLAAWVSSRRRFVLFAHDFDEMARRQQRLVEWRRNWAHVVQCRSDPELQPEQLPTLLLVPGLASLRLVDRVHHRGTVSTAAVDLANGRECIDALLQRSTEAFPVTTLGL